jgi:hypothetical protein
MAEFIQASMWRSESGRQAIERKLLDQKGIESLMV